MGYRCYPGRGDPVKAAVRPPPAAPAVVQATGAKRPVHPSWIAGGFSPPLRGASHAADLYQIILAKGPHPPIGRPVCTGRPQKYMLALIGVHRYSSYNTGQHARQPVPEYESFMDDPVAGIPRSAQGMRHTTGIDPVPPERLTTFLQKVDDDQWKTTPLPKRNGPAV